MTCKGMTCTYDPPEINDHSLECEAQHAAAIAGGTFVKWSVAMTDEQDRALCEAYCNDASDEYFNARPASDSPENRRIFYAGHRKAWIARAIEAHITGEKTE